MSRTHPDTAGRAVTALACVGIPGHGDCGPGPWRSALWFTVPGRVWSKSNYRNSSRRSSWADVTGYEELVHSVARAARPADWPRPDPAADRPLVVALLAARTGLDAGNLSKSVLDACQGALYVADAQVTCLTDLVVPARTDLGLFAAFAALPTDASAADLLAAQAALLHATGPLLTGPVPTR